MLRIPRSVSQPLLPALGLLLVFALALPGTARALFPSVSYSLRDGPPPDGSADDLILPPDSNYARVFQSTLFDAEFYVEFPLAGASTETDVNLALGIVATDIDLVLGESKTFKISVYEGGGSASLATFGSGVPFDTVVLPTNGAWDLDFDITGVWNAAVLDGHAYLGIRIHDPVWTGSVTGAGTLIVTSAVIEGVPEPGQGALAAAALVTLAGLARRRSQSKRLNDMAGANR